MKLFLDTNVWLRYLIADNDTQYQTARKILQLNEEHTIQICTSTFVLSEIVYVASSFYDIDRKEITNDIQTIREIKNISIIEHTNIAKTLDLYSNSGNTKWSDCIIAAQVPNKYILCSFDKKLKGLMDPSRFILPEEVISSDFSNQ